MQYPDRLGQTRSLMCRPPAALKLNHGLRGHERLVRYSTRYQQVIEALARPLTFQDGVPEAEIAAGEQRLGFRLPSALREYYLIAGRFDQLNCAHN